jgi:uncharacterized protein YjbI with pentapeptide repeats
VNLRQAHLSGANLWAADLRQATLIQADLRGADLTQTLIAETDLREASYSARTTFDVHFDPVGAGMQAAS